jgi:hypothetical protein
MQSESYFTCGWDVCRTGFYHRAEFAASDGGDGAAFSAAAA